MKSDARACSVISVAYLILLIPSPAVAQEFPLTSDSLVQPNVPKGDVKGPFRWESKIYPGTVRDYWVYVPQQYDPLKQACVFVIQDGLKRATGWHAATVLDNLIHKGEVPVQIGIFVAPGTILPVLPGAERQHNRSLEYDALGDRYARFLIEEILPAVQQDYHISEDPNDGAVAGSSSGGICAMNVAWERPDRFRRVFSGIGTFAALRGGDIFPTLIRKYENRPLRVFLQDGSNNASAWGGDGYLAGQSMLSAFKYAGYDVRHEFGSGGHDDRHGAQVLPEALRFLWHDYPNPVAIAERPKSMFHVDITEYGERWQAVSTDHRSPRLLTASADGSVVFCSGLNRIQKIDADGTETTFSEHSGDPSGLTLAPDGRLYACETESGRIVRYLANGEKETIVNDAYAAGCVILPDGSGCFTNRSAGQVERFRPDGHRTVEADVPEATALTLSADRGFLMVSSRMSRFIWSFQIQSDGSLKHGQKFGWLQLPDDVRQVGGTSMTVDENGLTYVTTQAGVQVLDGAGRLVMILESPERAMAPAGITFGGSGHRDLYVSCGQTVYKRRMKVAGSTWETGSRIPGDSDRNDGE